MSKTTFSNSQNKKIIELDKKIAAEEQKIKELKEQIETDSKNLKEQKELGFFDRFLRGKVPNETAIKIFETRIKKNQEDVLKSEKELKSLIDKKTKSSSSEVTKPNQSAKTANQKSSSFELLDLDELTLQMDETLYWKPQTPEGLSPVEEFLYQESFKQAFHSYTYKDSDIHAIIDAHNHKNGYHNFNTFNPQTNQVEPSGFLIDADKKFVRDDQGNLIIQTQAISAQDSSLDLIIGHHLQQLKNLAGEFDQNLIYPVKIIAPYNNGNHWQIVSATVTSPQNNTSAADELQKQYNISVTAYDSLGSSAISENLKESLARAFANFSPSYNSSEAATHNIEFTASDNLQVQTNAIDCGSFVANGINGLTRSSNISDVWRNSDEISETSRSIQIRNNDYDLVKECNPDQIANFHNSIARQASFSKKDFAEVSKEIIFKRDLTQENFATAIASFGLAALSQITQYGAQNYQQNSNQLTSSSFLPTPPKAGNLQQIIREPFASANVAASNSNNSRRRDNIQTVKIDKVSRSKEIGGISIMAGERSLRPTPRPTAFPTLNPTIQETSSPTFYSTNNQIPTEVPTESPIGEFSNSPSRLPTQASSNSPTTPFPSEEPTMASNPSQMPSAVNTTSSPSQLPTQASSNSSITSFPSEEPTIAPSFGQTPNAGNTTSSPSQFPSQLPTQASSNSSITSFPSEEPTIAPSFGQTPNAGNTTSSPTQFPSPASSNASTTSSPTLDPSFDSNDDQTPTEFPTEIPINESSNSPSQLPTQASSNSSTTSAPTSASNNTQTPSLEPTIAPTLNPTPSQLPTLASTTNSTISSSTSSSNEIILETAGFGGVASGVVGVAGVTVTEAVAGMGAAGALQLLLPEIIGVTVASLVSGGVTSGGVYYLSNPDQNSDSSPDQNSDSRRLESEDSYLNDETKTQAVSIVAGVIVASLVAYTLSRAIMRREGKDRDQKAKEVARELMNLMPELVDGIATVLSENTGQPNLRQLNREQIQEMAEALKKAASEHTNLFEFVRYVFHRDSGSQVLATRLINDLLDPQSADNLVAFLNADNDEREGIVLQDRVPTVNFAEREDKKSKLERALREVPTDSAGFGFSSLPEFEMGLRRRNLASASATPLAPSRSSSRSSTDS